MSEDLYNSLYAHRAYEERCQVMKKLVTEYDVNKGRVLEIGAGQGGNVNFLRDCGYSDDRIVLNEMDPQRIAHARREYPHIKIVEGNALVLEFENEFDCVFQSTVFTSVTDVSDRKTLAEVMWKALKPGGIILWYDFIYNNPGNPAVKKVSIKETLALFPRAVKTEVHRVTLAPPVGRRLEKFYAWFNWPVLRSHIVAIMQKEN